MMTLARSINHKIGKEAIKPASEGFKKPWKMKQENRSRSYTTMWNALIKLNNVDK
jgi:DNA polymerase V